MLEQYILESVVLYSLALILALHEIEIEGKHGWAENLPTWKITSTPLSGNKPLTGYHLTLGLIVLYLFHLPFIYGRTWTLATELIVISKTLILATFWDYLWFIFNPDFGPRKFKKENIPWYNEKWVLNKIPITYICVAITCTALITTAYLLTNQKHTIIQNITVLITSLTILTGLSIVTSPYYRNFRKDKELQKDS